MVGGKSCVPFVKNTCIISLKLYNNSLKLYNNKNIKI